ncbi:MAG: hypothetical protein ACE5OZ_07955 [Candidatus Heimdallarchaeota archaeon]
MSKISLPKTLSPLLAHLLEDWRGLYRACKTRFFYTTISREEFARLRVLADNFLRVFRDDPRVTFEEATYWLWSSVSITGHSLSFRFPVDLFIAESHADVLPALLRRLRTTPGLEEGAVIDHIVQALHQITILLRLNDICLITLLSDPAFLQQTHYLFPTEQQLARALAVHEKTVHHRLWRLLNADVVRLHYWANPRSFSQQLAIAEQLWPLEDSDHKFIFLAFETAPQQGITITLRPASQPFPQGQWPVREFLYVTNLGQLKPAHQTCWLAYPPLTEQPQPHPFSANVVTIDLTTPPAAPLSTNEEALLALLQATGGRDGPRLERETGLSSADVQTQVLTLVEGHHCYPLLALQRLGLHYRICVYLDGTADQVATFRQNLLHYPQLVLFAGTSRLVAMVSLPESWVYPFVTDLERLKLAGWRLYYRVGTPASWLDLWKPVSLLMAWEGV